jgi:Tfp pilus assembly PilM family ATPase
MASVAVLFGLAGLFVFNVVFGPLAIGVGVAACRRRSAAGWVRTAALAGATLGVLDLVVLAVIAAVSLASGNFTWHFGA